MENIKGKITEKKKQKSNNMAHLVSLVAIIALVIALGIILMVRAVLKNQDGKIDAELAESILNGNGEEMNVRLEEVQKNLESLESTLNDSALALNTLYDTQDEEERTKLEESMTRMDELSEYLTTIKTEVFNLRDIIDSNEEYDVGVMMENFSHIFTDVDKLRNDLDDVLQKCINQNKDSENNINNNLKYLKEQLNLSINNTNTELAKSIDSTNEKLSKTIKDSNNSLTQSLNDTNESLKQYINDSNESLKQKTEDENSTLWQNISASNEDIKSSLNSGNEGLMAYLDQIKNALDERFNKVDSDIESVFQYVANGKKGISSALATIHTDVDINEDTGDYLILPFETLIDKIQHSQDINGTYEEGEEILNLSGTTPNNLPRGKAAWVMGEYIIGNGADIDNARNQGYESGYADGLAEIYNANIVYSLGHVHTGGTLSYAGVSGCYESVYEAYTYTSTFHETCTGPDGVSQYCGRCGASLSSSGGISWGVSGCTPHNVTGYRYAGHLICGMEEGDFVRDTSDLSTMTDGEKILKAEITF